MDQSFYTVNKAAVMLTLFEPKMQEEIIRFCASRGISALTEVREVARDVVRIRPAFGFMSTALPARLLVNLARAMRIVMGDALAGDWDAAKYGKALARAASIPQSEAEKIAATEIVTGDMATAQFARRLLYSAADLPADAFDDAQAGVLGGIINAVESIWNDGAYEQNDVLYELSRLGGVVGDFADRAQLLAEEVEYERAPGSPDVAKDSTASAMAALPMLARAVLAAMGNRMESGDITDDERGEFSETLSEIGDLMVEGRTLTPEQGGFGSFLKRVGRIAKKAVNVVKKVAAPLATAMIPGASIAMDIGKSILPSDADRRVISNAAAYGGKYPAIPLTQGSGRVALADLVRMLNQLRSSGVSVG